jgi:hypothetical protein
MNDHGFYFTREIAITPVTTLIVPRTLAQVTRSS